MEKPIIHSGTISRALLIANIVMALVYISWWFIPGHVGNIYLYSLLIFGELYHVLMSITFWMTMWPQKNSKPPLYSLKKTYRPSVDIFITVAGEPGEVVAKTISGALAIPYAHKKIYILNDGFVAKKDNWEEIEKLCHAMKVECITRKTPGGAKAGNINYALRKTHGEIVCVLDADMVPYFDFLEKLIPYFQDETVGFVQSPQYYKNHSLNTITKGAWEQQEFFFGPVMRGKENYNAAFICGTNFAVRRSAIEEVGGMNEKNIAEDFLTSLSLHQKGWKSYYVPEVLAYGLAPEDLLSYYKQQLRWARGSLEVLFAQNPFFKRHLSFSQRIQYISSALFYFNAVIVVIDMIMPLLFLFTGIEPVSTTTTSFALFFIPFMALNLYTLFKVSEGYLTFRAISFSQSCWVLQLQALGSVLTGQKMGFSVTPKEAQQGNFVYLAYPHMLYIVASLIGFGYGVAQHGFSPSVITNVAWAGFNCCLFVPFIYSSLRPRVPTLTEPLPNHPSTQSVQFLSN